MHDKQEECSVVIFTYISGKDFKGSIIKVQMAQHKNNYASGRGGRGGSSGSSGSGGGGGSSGGGSSRGGGMDRGGRGGGRDNVRVESGGGKQQLALCFAHLNYLEAICIQQCYIGRMITGM